MEIKDLPNWQAFEHELDELRAQLKYLNTSLLFRGQADSDWPLSTTLERAGCDGLQFDTYYRPRNKRRQTCSGNVHWSCLGHSRTSSRPS